MLDDCGLSSVATAVRYFELNTGWTPQPIGQPTRLRGTLVLQLIRSGVR
jgi:hypothetical protein